MDLVTSVATVGGLIAIGDFGRRCLNYLMSDRYLIKKVRERIEFADENFALADRLRREGYLELANQLRRSGQAAIPRLVFTYEDRRSHPSTLRAGGTAWVLFWLTLVCALLTKPIEARFGDSIQYLVVLVLISVGSLGFVALVVVTVALGIRSDSRVKARIAAEIA